MTWMIFMKANQNLCSSDRTGRPITGPESLPNFLKFSMKAYNAFFTPMGRRNLYFFIKKIRASLDPNYRTRGAWTYTLADGRRFVAHRGDRLSEQVYLEGAYEPLETEVVSKIVQPGDVALDVGANVGYYTALLDGLVKPNGTVHAFEPGEATFQRLGKTKELLHLGRATLHSQAICDTVGHIDFWVSEAGLDGQQSTLKNAGLGQQARCIRVEATTLDAVLAQLKSQGTQNIAFIKCDIEGAEFSMLKGAQTVLNSQDPPIWLIEHNRKVLWSHGTKSSDLLSFFTDSDVFYSPLGWPPSVAAADHVTKWSGVADELPDECNLLIFPRRGKYVTRAAVLKQSGLILK